MLTLVLNMIATVLCTGTVTYAVNRHRIGAGRVLCIVVMSVLSGMFVYGCFTDLVKTLQIAACIAGCFLPVYGAVRLRAETAASEKRRARKRTRALLKRHAP